MKLETNKVLQGVTDRGTKLLAELGVNIAKDDVTIVQGFDDGQAVIIKVNDDEEGRRGIRYDVNDTTVVLEPMKGTLDVFGDDEDEDEVEYHEDTLEKLKEKVLLKRIVALTPDILTLEGDVKISFECTEQDCCASADGEWESGKFEGVVTDVRLLNVRKIGDEDDYGQTEMVAELVLFHNDNEVARANLRADNGNADYYYSVLSVFVNAENLGVILNSYY